MAPVITIKDIARESQLFKSRVVFSCVLAGCLSLLLAARMLQLEVLEYEHFKTLSDDTGGAAGTRASNVWA